MEEDYGNVSEQVVSAPENDYDNSNGYEDTSVDLSDVDVTPEDNFDNSSENFTGENEEVADPQNYDDERSIQSAEENSRFARLRRESEQRGMDRAIAELGLQFQGQPITSYADYQYALQQQALIEEAQQNGIDPQFYTDFRNMQEELQAYRQEKTFMQQDKELSQDSVKGEFYKEWKDEITEMANQYNIDLRTAFTLKLEEKLPDILNSRSQKVQNETIKKLNQNSNSAVRSLSQQNDVISNAWDMPSSDFNKMVERAKNGELRGY